MATTDTRSGFRLPWSSDRPQDAVQAATPVDAADETTAVAAEPAETADGTEASTEDDSWPEVNVDERLDKASTTHHVDNSEPPAPTPEEQQAMVETVIVPAAVAAPRQRKPSKLLADLATAMRATAETAREQAVAQVEADVRQVVESIRASATEAAAELRQRSDDDIAGIRDWSKAEIARIREETERRISGRKSTLEDELVGHAAAVDRRVEDVQHAVAEYQAEMTDFFERMLAEEDAARLATMAETMPEPPTLEPFLDLSTLEVAVIEPAPEAVAQPEVEAEAEPVVEATTEAEAEVEADSQVAAEAESEPNEEAGAVVAERSDPWAADASSSWGTGDTGWGGSAEQAAPSSTAVPGWMTELPNGVDAPLPDGTVDREAIMAALEAAAEAIVASEAAGESGADSEEEWQFGADAAAALAARMDAAGFSGGLPVAQVATNETSDPGEAALVDATPEESAATQLMVTGLVSVASIASFKRHLSRMAGVRGVAVSSGPDGEFVFNVSHQPDLLFSDAIPTMPGFGARVTGIGDGVVNVTARDPETEA